MPDYSLECPSCGETSPATARFCGSCQTQLSSIPQSASDAGAQSAHLGGSQPTSISPTKTSTRNKVLGWAAIAWGALLLLIGAVDISEGDIDYGLVCLVVGATPLYGGIKTIRNNRFLGIPTGVIAIALVVLSMFILGAADGLDDVSPT